MAPNNALYHVLVDNSIIIYVLTETYVLEYTMCGGSAEKGLKRRPLWPTFLKGKMVRCNLYCGSIFCTLWKMELRNMISCHYEKSLDFTYKNRVQVLDINRNKFKLHQDQVNNDEVTHLKHDSYLEACFTFRMQTQSQQETSFSFHMLPSFSPPKQGRHLKEGGTHVIGDPHGCNSRRKEYCFFSSA